MTKFFHIEYLPENIFDVIYSKRQKYLYFCSFTAPDLRREYLRKGFQDEFKSDILVFIVDKRILGAVLFCV